MTAARTTNIKGSDEFIHLFVFDLIIKYLHHEKGILIEKPCKHWSAMGPHVTIYSKKKEDFKLRLRHNLVITSCTTIAALLTARSNQ